MREIEEIPEQLPEFKAGVEIWRTPYHRVIMGWKPGFEEEVGIENHPDGRRFIIEPLNDEGEQMLLLAAAVHRVPSFHQELIPNGSRQLIWRNVLRADFIPENLRVVYGDEVVIPREGEDTIPPLGQMMQCIINHPDFYSFDSDENL